MSEGRKKWPQNPILTHCWAIFPIFRLILSFFLGEAETQPIFFLYFFFSYFGLEARNRVCTRQTGSQFRANFSRFLSRPYKAKTHKFRTDRKVGRNNTQVRTSPRRKDYQINFANPFPPYSLQKRPKPQICPKFVPAIVLGGSSQGD